MLGSHNSFSYLPVTKWWMHLLSPWHRCQDNTVFHQLESGIRYLDIRVRFINGKPVFVHNHITYRSCFSFMENMELIAWFIQKHSIAPVFYRLVLDIRKKPKNPEFHLLLFKTLVKTLQECSFSNVLKLDDARVFWDWGNPLVSSQFLMQEFHSSVSSTWWQYLLGTKWFAYKYNSQYLSSPPNASKSGGNFFKVHLLDFVV